MRKLITIVLIQFCSLLSFAQFTDTQCDEQGIEYTANNDGTTCTVTGYIDDCHADIVIPEVYEGLTVSSIGECAFDECERLTSIVIPNSVSSIGESAFVCCTALTSITIPNSVTDIGYGAFYECINLSSIVIGNTVTNIGEDAFNGCKGLTSIIIPSSVTSIDWL